jgi:hypothetical protein
LFYKKLTDNKTQTNNGTPNINEIKEFWSNIWSNEVQFNNQAEWIPHLENDIPDSAIVRYQCNVTYRRQLYAFCSLLLKLKQIHNLKNRVFPHIISDYKENPRPTLFVNSLENSTISILYV